MAAEKELSFIAQRIRTLVDSKQRFTGLVVMPVWKLVCEAIEFGAFANVEFTEFRAFFDAWRETEKIETESCSIQGVPIGGFVDRLPVTMMDALIWLARNGSVYGHPNNGLEQFGSDYIPPSCLTEISVDGGTSRQIVELPRLDRLRPHFEFLARLIEVKRLSPRRKPQKGNAGRPRIKGTEEERNFQLYDDWQTAKAAGITMKDFCNDPENRKRGITTDEVNRVVGWVYRRRQRGQL